MKIEKDAPPSFSVTLDAWSEFHHGYMGINSHHLNEDWVRIITCLACKPFDERHKACNIYKCLENVLNDWKILEKTGLCIRDNATNMVATFNVANVPECILSAAGCLNHSLQV